MNTVGLIGRLTADPKLDEEKRECTFTLAVVDVTSKVDRADCINIVVHDRQAELCKRYLSKGFLAAVQGHVHTDIVPDEDGTARYPVYVAADRVQFLQWQKEEAKR
jgi:single-strand DNA-binding protein